MKLTLTIVSCEPDALKMLEAALRFYDTVIEREGDKIKLTAIVNHQQYVEVMCLVSCFECHDATLEH